MGARVVNATETNCRNSIRACHFGSPDARRRFTYVVSVNGGDPDRHGRSVAVLAPGGLGQAARWRGEASPSTLRDVTMMKRVRPVPAKGHERMAQRPHVIRRFHSAQPPWNQPKSLQASPPHGAHLLRGGAWSHLPEGGGATGKKKLGCFAEPTLKSGASTQPNQTAVGRGKRGGVVLAGEAEGHALPACRVKRAIMNDGRRDLVRRSQSQAGAALQLRHGRTRDTRWRIHDTGNMEQTCRPPDVSSWQSVSSRSGAGRAVHGLRARPRPRWAQAGPSGGSLWSSVGSVSQPSQVVCLFVGLLRCAVPWLDLGTYRPLPQYHATYLTLRYAVPWDGGWPGWPLRLSLHPARSWSCPAPARLKKPLCPDFGTSHSLSARLAPHFLLVINRTHLPDDVASPSIERIRRVQLICRDRGVSDNVRC